LVAVVPVWLLDIDGVINALGNSPPRDWPIACWRSVEAESAHNIRWPIVAAQPVLDFIAVVHDKGQAEIRWHTSWQGFANNVSRELGLPEFPLQPAPEYDEPLSFTWWKLPAARRVLEEGRRLIWTDDDFSEELTRAQRRELSASGRALLLGPDTMTGLRRRHLKRIEAFLQRGS
jgi:hypothetical protein